MKHASLAAAIGTAVLAAAPVTALADNVIGSAGQSSNQAVNSAQQGKNAVSAPTQAILGTSSNSFGQTSANSTDNAQGIGAGSPTGEHLVATPGGPGFAQQSTQGINSLQNGGRVQTSTNALGSAQIVGDGLLAPTVLIGGAVQNNRQGVNSNQIGATSGHRTQTSTNSLVNVQLVTAQVIIGSAGQANFQGVDSAQSIPSGKKTTGTDVLATGQPGVSFPGFTLGTPTGPVTQTSTNGVVNAQLILG